MLYIYNIGIQYNKYSVHCYQILICILCIKILLKCIKIAMDLNLFIRALP